MLNQAYPIVFLSVFKSGTEMMKRVIEDLTGLLPMEPQIIPGKVNYQDPAQLYFQHGCFYAWHLFPIPEVQRKLIAAQARPIFLLRNIYDLVVSIYYHFANNIDADLGRGRNVDHYFRAISKEAGLDSIIDGMVKPDFVWKGIGPQLQQMEMMLQFSEIYPCFITTFEDMTQQKSAEVKRLAKFLEITLEADQLQNVIYNSQFEVMKEVACRQNIGSHFRKGSSGSHVEELNLINIEKIQKALISHTPNLLYLLEKANLLHVVRAT